MEEIKDFDQWAVDFQPPQLEFAALYDPDTGEVTSVGPSHAFADETYTVPVDIETAKAIIEGAIRISSCVVDLDSNTFEIAELKNIKSIDDLLHRIIDKSYSIVDKQDIHLTYDKEHKRLIVELSEEYGGTKKLGYKVEKKRKTKWSGETDMNFLITSYNDPNVIYKTFVIKLNDLVKDSVIIKDVDFEKFSVYTKRLFKNYVIEYK